MQLNFQSVDTHPFDAPVHEFGLTLASALY